MGECSEHRKALACRHSGVPEGVDRPHILAPAGRRPYVLPWAVPCDSLDRPLYYKALGAHDGNHEREVVNGGGIIEGASANPRRCAHFPATGPARRSGRARARPARAERRTPGGGRHAWTLAAVTPPGDACFARSVVAGRRRGGSCRPAGPSWCGGSRWFLLVLG